MQRLIWSFGRKILMLQKLIETRFSKDLLQ